MMGSLVKDSLPQPILFDYLAFQGVMHTLGITVFFPRIDKGHT
jgi:hypothetical protein